MLVVKGLKVIRGSFKVALNDFYIDDGECVALCGVSGSGKSTLLEALGLLTPAFEVQRFVLDNIEVDELSQREAQALRVSALGIMPQVGGLVPYLTVAENWRLQIQLALKQQVRAQSPSIQDQLKSDPLSQRLSTWVNQVSDLTLPCDNCDSPGGYRGGIYYGSTQKPLLPSHLLHRLNGERLARRLTIHNEASAEMEQSYLKALVPYCEKLQLEGLLDKYPHELSIGQRQRALFLRALAHKPRLLLIDEPTSALDPDNARALFELIDEIAQVSRISVLVVTHDLRASERYRRYLYDASQSHSEYSVFIPEPAVDQVESADLSAHVKPTSARLTKHVLATPIKPSMPAPLGQLTSARDAVELKQHDMASNPALTQLVASSPELSAQAVVAACAAEDSGTDTSTVARWGEIEVLGEILVDMPAASHIMDETYVKTSTRKAAGSSALAWLQHGSGAPWSADEIAAQQALERAEALLPFGFSYYTSAPDKLRQLHAAQEAAQAAARATPEAEQGAAEAAGAARESEVHHAS